MNMHYSILNPLIVFLHLNQEILLAKLNFYSIFMVKIHKRDKENAQILTKLTGTWKKSRQFLILKWKSDVLAILAALISLVGVR